MKTAPSVTWERFEPEALNNVGHVAGYLADADLSYEALDYKSYAVLWNGAELVRLFDAPVFSKGSSINDLSEIAGTFDKPFETNASSSNAKDRRAFLWSHGNYSLITRPAGHRVLKIMGLNNHGLIVANVVPRHVRKGQGCKQICVGGKEGWQFIDLPKRRNSQSAVKLNNRNQVLCTSSTFIGKMFSSTCWLWDAGALFPIDIWGRDLNDLGQVVGFHIADALPDRKAMLWQDGQVFDLNDLVPPNTGWTLHRADGINNREQIIGRGTFEGTDQAFLLTPVSL